MTYLIGSLSNTRIIGLTKLLHEKGIPVFSQWLCSGPEADQHWKNYGKEMGWSYMETVKSDFVQTAFNFDYKHMQASDTCVLVMPAGKSAHAEFGWFVGSGRKAYILFDGEPDRPDLMPPNLATKVFFSIEELVNELKSSDSVICKEQHPNTRIYASTLPYCCGCDCACCKRNCGRS